MSASLRAGRGAASADVVVVHLVDLPDVPAAAVRRVLDRGGRTRDALARATYDGRPGHPVLVGADHVAALTATLAGDHGARAYLEAHAALTVECGDLADGLDEDAPERSSPRRSPGLVEKGHARRPAVTASRDVLPALLGWWRSGQACALATVVGTWSSAPRQPGASMLVGPDGSVVGSLSGGCVESDVHAVAEQVLVDGAAVTRR